MGTLTEQLGCCAGTLWNPKSRVTQQPTVSAWRQAVQRSPLIGLAVSVGPPVTFLHAVMKQAAGSGFFWLIDTHHILHARRVLHVEVLLGTFKKPHLLSFNMPHNWFSSTLPDTCRYINSEWATTTSFHIVNMSLFTMLSYHSKLFCQVRTTDKVLAYFAMFRLVCLLLNAVSYYSCIS
jgi:hypothetical protein